jgi:hypothetical protein
LELDGIISILLITARQIRTIRTHQKWAKKYAFWRELGEKKGAKNPSWRELWREQRGEKIPIKHKRLTRLGYAVDRIFLYEV